MLALHLDIETRSEINLTTVGSYVYFAHPSTDILCAAYAFGDKDEPKIWTPDQPCPQAIIDHVNNGGKIVAWNAAFERQGWNSLLHPRYGWPLPKLEQFRCTMAETLAMNLPGKLEAAAPALGLDIRKDEAGHKLMMQMCKPRPNKKNPSVILWWEDDARKQRLYEYCKQDVRTEQAISTRVLPLRPEELKIFHLDAKINDRGVFIDEKLCHYAKAIVAVETNRLNKRMYYATGGKVPAATNVSQIIQFLGEKGVNTASVAQEALTDLLILDIPEKCQKVLEIRQEAAKTSTAKINAMLARRDADGRMRGNVQYHGAGTGRWAARGAQLQNLPRPVIIKGDGEAFSQNYEFAIANIMLGSNEILELLYDRPLTVVADCIRGMIIAAPGNELIAADFSNIEGRDTAWLAGQEDKLDAFRAFDNGTGADLYLLAASAVYGVPVKDAKHFRQVGKVCELALGFQGGAGAFANMAKNYGLKVGKLFDGIRERASEATRQKAEAGWESRGKRSGMEKHAWIAAELIKLAWRQKNHRIADYWKELNNAALDAYDNPGEVVVAGKVRYRVNGSFLWCRLPSGRALCYPYPRLQSMIMAEYPDGYQESMPRHEAIEQGLKIVGDARSRLVYKTVDQWTRKFREKPFYGGLAMENIAQAVARDVMAEAMVRLEDAGYPVVLTVHDEIICEIPEGYGSLEEFNQIMTMLPAWAEGLPIAASGWRGHRYRKG